MAYNIEKAIAGWVVSDWHYAQQTNDWNLVCHCLYGAVQSCIWNNDDEGYEAYKFLVEIARELRYVSAYRKAA